MNSFVLSFVKVLGIVAMVVFSMSSMAQFEKPHKLVIQVSSADPVVQRVALNNAVNVQKALGIDNVEIEIVAYGPGLSLLTPKNEQSTRIPDLALSDITFSACGNTMDTIKKKSGKMPVLVEGVTVVQAGVVRIMELQEQGYSYVRP